MSWFFYRNLAFKAETQDKKKAKIHNEYREVKDQCNQFIEKNRSKSF